MKSLVKVEWLKIRKYNAFWWIMGITALSYPGINYIFYSEYDSITRGHNKGTELLKLYLGNPFTFPEGWHTVSYFSSLFVFIPAVVVIMFITNEFSFRTNRQNVIDGWSRNQFMSAKLIDVLLISLIITILNALVAFVLGITNPIPEQAGAWSKFYYIGLFALQTFAQLSIAFLVGFLVRKAFLALGVFIFYFIILENILVAVLQRWVNDIGEWLPLEASDRLVPRPAFMGSINIESYERSLNAIQPHILYTLAITAVIWTLCYRINNRRDL